MGQKLANADVGFIHPVGVFATGQLEVDLLGDAVDFLVDPIGALKGLFLETFFLRVKLEGKDDNPKNKGYKGTNVTNPPRFADTVLRLTGKGENKLRLFFLMTMLFFSATAATHEPVGGDIRATAAMFRLQSHARQDSFQNPWKGGLGLVVEGDVDHNGGLEIGMLYMEKLFAIHRDGMTVVEESKRMYISMGYRHWFNKRVSAAAAFFSSYQMGDGRTIRDDFPMGMTPKTSARDVTEYGFDLSVQYEPWSARNIALVLDGRYSWSVTPKPDEDANHYMAMVGIKYYVQGKQPDEDEGAMNGR